MKLKRWWGTKSFWNCSSRCKRIGAKIPNFSMPLTGDPCGVENWIRAKVPCLNATHIYCTVVYTVSPSAVCPKGQGQSAGYRRCDCGSSPREDRGRFRSGRPAHSGGCSQRRSGAHRQNHQRQAKIESGKTGQESKGCYGSGRQAGRKSRIKQNRKCLNTGRFYVS